MALVAAAELVQAARHHLLAGAGFAVDQHIGRFVGQVQYGFAQGAHRRRIAQQRGLDALAMLDAMAQRRHFQHQAARLLRALHHLGQLFGRIRLGDEVIRTVAHRSHRHADIAMAGHQHHRQLRVDGLGGCHEIQPAHAGQAHVADHHAGKAGRDLRQRRLGASKRLHFKARQIQRLRTARAHSGVVFDQ
jgi:hypothetical protein